MPTGYTEKVEEGSMTELEDFAMECATAFVNSYGSRDSNKSLDHFEVDDYFYKEYEEAKKAYNDFLANPPTREQAEKAYVDFVEEEKKRIEAYNEETRNKLGRYERMLSKVKSWKPGKDYKELKNFMAQQLESSMEWEILIEPYMDTPEKREDFITDYMSGDLEETRVELAREELMSAKKNIEEKNRWLEGLRKALKKG